MFIVMALKEKVDLDVLGKTISLDLSFAEGMVGALPVFKDKESAEKWAGENRQIFEVALTEKD